MSTPPLPWSHQVPAPLPVLVPALCTRVLVCALLQAWATPPSRGSTYRPQSFGGAQGSQRPSSSGITFCLSVPSCVSPPHQTPEALWGGLRVKALL